MASISTYAKLIKPAMFAPADGGDVTFRLEYSEDLTGLRGTLVIYGYNDGNGITGTSADVFLNESEAGAGIAEITVPAASIASAPEGDESRSLGSGRAKARVDVYDENGELVFQSNEVYVDMLIMWERDLSFINTPLVSSGSAFTVNAHYVPRHDFGGNGSVDIASYRYFLYSSEKLLIDDSGELTDWNSALNYYDAGYTFRGLKDRTHYFVTLKVTLNGGYTLYRRFEPLYAEYGDIPQTSERLKLYCAPGGVRLELPLAGTAHNHVVFSRAERDILEYIALADVYTDGNCAVYTDKYAVPGRNYIYCASVYNGDEAVLTVYGTVSYVSDCIKIADIVGCYTAFGELTKTPVNRNSRGSILEAMDSALPYCIINGSANYESGKVSAFFSEEYDCAPVTDNRAYSNALRKWLNNGRPKLLTCYTGEAWIVSVSDISTADPDKTDTYITSFGWTQIGDADKLSDHVRLGLVGTE